MNDDYRAELNRVQVDEARAESDSVTYAAEEQVRIRDSGPTIHDALRELQMLHLDVRGLAVTSKGSGRKTYVSAWVSRVEVERLIDDAIARLSTPILP